MVKNAFRRASSKLNQSLQKIRFNISGDTTVLIVMYHSICTPPSDKVGPWKYTVSPSLFEEQIDKLSKKYEIVTIDKLLERRESSNNLAVITFDDGYKNNLTEAVPILEKYEVPATIYISTSFINDRVPYEFLLSGTIVKKESINVTIAGESFDYRLDSPRSNKKAFQEIKQLVKRSPLARQELIEKLSIDDVDISMLNPNEIRELDEHPLTTVGAHGYRHLPLTSLPARKLKKEVEKCTSDLEDILGHTVSHFSYPYGSNDATVRQVIQDAGYKSAVATNPSYVGLQNITEYQFKLPRFDASSRGVK